MAMVDDATATSDKLGVVIGASMFASVGRAQKTLRRPLPMPHKQQEQTKLMSTVRHRSQDELRGALLGIQASD